MDLSGILGAFGQGLQPIGQTLAPMHQPIADNRMALMGLGAGLMSGPMSTAMPDAMKQMMYGALVDEKSRAAKMAELEKARLHEMQVQQARAAGLEPIWAGTSLPGAVMASRLKPQGGGREPSFTEQQWNLLSEADKEKARRGMFKLDGDEPKRNLTADITEYEYAKSQGYQGTYPDWKASKVAEKPLTVEQGKAGAFADRASNSESVLSELGSLGTDRTFRLHEQYSDQVESGRAGMLASGANALAGGLGAKLGQAALTPEQQKLRRAENDFLTAILRKESGAVIGLSEFPQERVKYLPQPGDSSEVLADKKEARRIAIEGLKRESGPAYKSSVGPGSARPVTPDEALAELRRRGLIK